MSNAASTPEFRAILQSLYDSGQYRTSGEVLREAWAEYRRKYGDYPPSRITRRFAAPRGRTTYSSKNLPRTKVRGLSSRKKKTRHKRQKTSKYGFTYVKVSGKPYRIPLTRKQWLASQKRRGWPTEINPIAVYNPKARLTKLPASQIEIRYKRTGGKYAGKWFKHEFKSSIGIYGMSDGSVLLKSLSGKKLWGTA